MTSFRHDNWLLEVADRRLCGDAWWAWVSTPDRMPIGHGQSTSQGRAVEAATARALRRMPQAGPSIAALIHEWVQNGGA